MDGSRDARHRARLDALNSRVLLNGVLACGAATVWASVCAVAPEVIWQGFVLLRGHFGLAEAYTALFIGTLFAFFVEPLTERVKTRSWRLPREHTGNLLLGTLISVVFGIAVVCIHESLSAYVGSTHATPDAKQAGLAHALAQTQEWASIPAAIMLSWFAAGLSRRLAWPAAGLACVWIAAAGFAYGWLFKEVMATAIPCCIIALAGTKVVLRGWRDGTIPALAGVIAYVAISWLALSCAFVALAGHAGDARAFYTFDQIWEDARFYLGWFLGLSVAPNPRLERLASSGQPRGRPTTRA